MSRRATGVYKRHGRRCTGEPCACPWAYSLEIAADANDKRRVLSKSGFRTQKDAKEARAEMERAYRRDTLPTDLKTTVAEYADQWLAGKVERGELRPSTHRAYAAHLRLHIRPDLGRLRLRDLRAGDIDRMLSNARKANPNLSAASEARLFATCRTMLNYAVEDGLLSTNPCSKVRRRASEKHLVEVWQPEQAGAFLSDERVREHLLYPLLWTAIHTGMRRGELAALRWSDVNLDKQRLTIRQAAVVVGHEVQVGRAKTDAGQGRVIDLDAGTVAMLRSWRARQAAAQLKWGEAWADRDNRVFTHENGRAIHPEVLTKGFTRLVQTTGLPRLRFHDLRHLSASLAMAAGVPLAVVSKRLGHSQLSITSDFYSHLIGTVGQDAATATADLVQRHVKKAE